MSDTQPSYAITTSLKEDVFLRQKAIRAKINPLTNKKYTLADIVKAGVEALEQ